MGLSSPTNGTANQAMPWGLDHKLTNSQTHKLTNYILDVKQTHFGPLSYTPTRILHTILHAFNAFTDKHLDVKSVGV